MADVLKFVDSVSIDATLRLDLNDDAGVLHVRDVVWNPPRLRRSVSQNMMRDGGHVGPSSYDLRVLVLSFDVVAADQDEAAEYVQALVRELDRETNWLMYQPTGATHPVFFKTYRSDLLSVVDVPAAVAFRQLTVEVLTDPFAPGLEESFSGSFSFGSSGMTATCPTIKGDVAAPLRMALTIPAADYHMSFALSSIASSASTAPVVLTTNASLGTPAPGLHSLQTGLGATYFNGDAIRTLSLSTTPTTYLSEIPTTLTPGRWRVMARLRSTVGGFYYAAIAPYAGSALPPSTPAGAIFGTGTYGVVDLGVHSVPVGNPGRPAGGWTAISIEWRLWLWRAASATGQVDIDALIFIPVEIDADVMTRAGFVTAYANLASGTRILEVDGETETVSAYAGTTLPDMSEVNSSFWPRLAGDFLAVAPGQTNTLYMVPQVWATAASVATPPDITSSASFTAYYHPLYTSVRPVAT